MNVVELFLKDGRPSGVFYCGSCRIVYNEIALAEKCCKPKICKCGKETEERYSLICHDCQLLKTKQHEEERFNKAEKVDLADYNGWFYSECYGFFDGYFQDLGDLVEYCEDEGVTLPDYVWACTESNFAEISLSDIEDIIECRDVYEGFSFKYDMNGQEELEAAIAAFNEKNKDIKSYDVDYTRVIIINKKDE